MRYGRGNCRVTPCCRESVRRHCRDIVAVNEVVDDTRMVRLLRPGALQNRGRLLELPVSLVRRWPGRVEREGVEYSGLLVRREALVELLHRFSVGERARRVILLIAVA